MKINSHYHKEVIKILVDYGKQASVKELKHQHVRYLSPITVEVFTKKEKDRPQYVLVYLAKK